MSREWTAARIKRLRSAVAERCLTCGDSPDAISRLVLQAVLRDVARGAELPARQAFAAALGISELVLNLRMEELRLMGLLSWSKRGSRPASYELDLDLIERWASGAISLPLAPRNAVLLWAENRGTDEPQRVDFQGAAHARGNSSSSSSPSLPQPTPATPPSEAFERDLRTATQVIGRTIGSLRPAQRDALRRHMVAGITLAVVEAHVPQATRTAGSWGWWETVLINWLDDRARSREASLRPAEGPGEAASSEEPLAAEAPNSVESWHRQNAVEAGVLDFEEERRALRWRLQ